eukprot:jgi/Botrbrau1/10145/Bobra.0191s0016.1
MLACRMTYFELPQYGISEFDCRKLLCAGNSIPSIARVRPFKVASLWRLISVLPLLSVFFQIPHSPKAGSLIDASIHLRLRR